MSSIPVISHNVIRQALEWMDFPEPLYIQTVSNFTFPNGRYQARLDVTWDAKDLLRSYTGVQLQPKSDHGLLGDLRECFCSDVFPIESTVNSKTGRVTVILSCTVNPSDYHG